MLIFLKIKMERIITDGLP